MNPNNLNRINQKENEIDLTWVVKVLWVKRNLIIIICSIFFVTGIFVAIFSNNEFTASTTFIPQTSDASQGAGGSLGGLASLAGVNLGSMARSSEISPALYPKFISSVTFSKSLLQAPITIDGLETPVTYAQYYEDYSKPDIFFYLAKYTIGLPGIVLSSVRGTSEVSRSHSNDGGLIRLTNTEIAHFNRLKSQVSISSSDKEGLVTLSFSMPEPLMAAQMAQYAQDLLQKEVIAYKISNAREQLNFTQDRYDEKQEEFRRAQGQLSYFRDRNQNIVSATAQNQLERLETEFNFAFNIYTDIAKQLEQAKLQVAKDTPVFSIIDPVTIPTSKSSPNKLVIIVIFTVIGFILVLIYVFGVEFINHVKKMGVFSNN